MPGPQDFGSDSSPVQQLLDLQQQELELERLRALLSPDHWPRIYAMLDRVRKEIRDIENALASKDRDAA